MKAMVLAAGLGSRLRPLTDEIPKAMVPVLDRPVMAHVVALCERHGFGELVANLHHFPEAITDYFGDRLQYRYEEELLGTAGAVRNARDFFGDDLVVVVSGDTLSDVDLTALVERHRSTGGVATLTVKRVEDTRDVGVVIHDSDGRIQGFQEKPHPDEALSEAGSCGIYCFSPEVFEYFPERDYADWAHDVFPALLENDVPLFVYETDAHWRDIGSLGELRTATFEAVRGELGLEVPGTEVDDGVRVGEGTRLPDDCELDGPAWIGAGCQLGDNVRLTGPVAIGDGARVGDGAALRDTIVFPGTEVAAGEILVGAIHGHTGIVESLRRPS